jgi:hypothetical protein
LAPASAAGAFTFVPHPGDLNHVEGTITMPQGQVAGSWGYTATAGTFTENLTSPAGTTATIGIPTYGSPAVTAKVNNATVWSGGVFTPTTGIGGASTDGRYIYLTGVTPGTYAVAGSGIVAPAPFAVSPTPTLLPAGYTLCAAEGGTCAPNGRQVMAYGAGSYSYRSVTAATACTTASSGGTDPAPNPLKYCYLAPIGGPSGYTRCAGEAGACSFAGSRMVAYGANGPSGSRSPRAASPAPTTRSAGIRRPRSSSPATPRPES